MPNKNGSGTAFYANALYSILLSKCDKVHRKRYCLIAKR